MLPASTRMPYSHPTSSDFLLSTLSASIAAVTFISPATILHLRSKHLTN
uniref:Uncharacterized protein n=1 Tax=Arundo donax TaxID=35708 RepID=A0A0A9DJP2_ARUDO